MAKGIKLRYLEGSREKRDKWDVFEVLCFILKVYANFGTILYDIYMTLLTVNSYLNSIILKRKESKTKQKCFLLVIVI